jgi:hypothetical protein
VLTVKNFFLGVVVGAAGALWFTQTRGRISVDQQFGQMQERANQVLNESRRILQETRQELGAALQAGRQTVQQTSDMLRHGGESAPTETPATGQTTEPPSA